MTTLIWLAASSLIWGAVLYCSVFVLQSRCELSGNARQWMWRGAAMLLLLPWIAMPLVSALGLGMASPAIAVEASLPAAAPEAAIASERVWAPSEGTMVSASSQRALDLGETLLAILILGWIVRFVVAQLAARSLGQVIARSRAADAGPASEALEAWTGRLRLRRKPRLRIVETGISPFSFGILRPVICLPDGLDRRLDRSALNLVVGHECLHVARGDGWLRPLERVVADIFWFNPFAWAMRRELDFARELACDEAVVELSSARRAYAKTLRDMASLSAGLPLSAPAASMSLGGGRSLMLRVARTLAVKRKPARLVSIAAGVLALAGGCASVGQAMVATPREGEAVHALAPALVVFAGSVEGEERYVELQQIGGEVGAQKAANCQIEAWGFDSLNVRTGDVLKVGDVVGRGKLGVSLTPVCWAMLDVEAPTAEALRREPRELPAVDAAGRRALGRTAPTTEFIPQATLVQLSPLTPKTPEAPVPSPAPAPSPKPVPAPSAPVAAAPQVAPSAPTPAVAPVPISPPVPGIFSVQSGQTLRLPFAARVVDVRDRAGSGQSFEATLVQTEDSSRMKGCTAMLAGMKSLSVKDGDIVPSGSPVGVVGENPNVSLSCQSMTGLRIDTNRARTRTLSFPPLKAAPVPGALAIEPAAAGGLLVFPAPTAVPAAPIDPVASRGGNRLRPAGPKLENAPNAVLETDARKTRGFGYYATDAGTTAFHAAIDLAARLGTQVHSPGVATVTFAGNKGNHGNVVELSMGDGHAMRFAHLDKIHVKAGDRIEAGHVIGTVGDDEYTTGPHLHFEYLNKGRSYDPEKVEGLILTRPG